MKELTARVHKKFSLTDGFFYKGLEDALQSLVIERQAYQGGTFVGNHVHKALQV